MCLWRSASDNVLFYFIYLFKQHEGQRAAYNVHTYINKISKLHKIAKNIKHEIYKYTDNNTRLLFKNYVKLTLRFHSNCSDVKEGLTLNQGVDYVVWCASCIQKLTKASLV